MCCQFNPRGHSSLTRSLGRASCERSSGQLKKMTGTFELIPGRSIGHGHPCFIIAEIGQNHQGELDIAKKLIRAAKEGGADCVKFQKTHLESKFNQAALQRQYNSPNSWGTTYGEHKRHLEFSEGEIIELQGHALSEGIPFTASGMDPVSMDFLNRIGVPFFKIGSGDGNNLSLIKKTAGYGRPLVVSTGMLDMQMVRDIHGAVTPINPRLCLLQCTSSYPCSDSDLNLAVIQTYLEAFPDVVTGFSGHEFGYEMSLASVALGAKVLERHLTLDHSWKGSDHTSSLEPQEFQRMVKAIRRLESAIGDPNKRRCESEEACYRKLGKTVVSSRSLSAGCVLEENMMTLKVAEPQGCPRIEQILGCILIRDLEADQTILQGVHVVSDVM